MTSFDLFAGYKKGNQYHKTPTPPKDELEFLHHKKLMTYKEIAEHYRATIKIVQRWFRQTGIKARKAYKRFQVGELNDSWKGKEATYSAFHRRLEAKYGKAKKCDECGTTDKEKNYDWANLSGDYKNLKGYKRLCRSCHWKHDKIYKNFYANSL